MTSALEGSPKKSSFSSSIPLFFVHSSQEQNLLILYVTRGVCPKIQKNCGRHLWKSPYIHTQRERERERERVSMGNVKEILGQISAFQFANVANIANILCEQNILPLFICGEAKQVYKRYDFLLFSSIQQVLGGQ